jgi:hypothetical protein
MRHLIAGIAAVLVLAITAPAWAVSDTLLVPGAGTTITFHPFTIPSDTGCVLWAADGSYNCDPVDLVFAGRSPSQVSEWLREKGWTTWGLGSTQRLHFATTTLYPQDQQLFRSDGRNAAGQTMRYHIRLWAVRGAATTVTLGAVHHEASTGFLAHTIDRSWESAEGFVAGQLCRSRCLSSPVLPTQSLMQGASTWRGWDNDAVATVVPHDQRSRETVT